MDGGKDILNACALSGVPVIPNIVSVIRPDGSMTTINDSWELALRKTAFQKKVLDAWNDTARCAKSGKPMDGLISPLAPFVAVRHNQYNRVSYPTWISFHRLIY